MLVASASEWKDARGVCRTRPHMCMLHVGAALLARAPHSVSASPGTIHRDTPSPHSDNPDTPFAGAGMDEYGGA